MAPFNLRNRRRNYGCRGVPRFSWICTASTIITGTRFPTMQSSMSLQTTRSVPRKTCHLRKTRNSLENRTRNRSRATTWKSLTKHKTKALRLNRSAFVLPDLASKLRLGCWRRCRRLCGGGFRRCRCSSFNRISLVVELDDVLRQIHLVRSVDDWRSLRGSVEHGRIAVLARVAIQNVHHLAADAVNHVLLRGIDVFLIFFLLPLKLLGECCALALQATLFILAQFVAARLQTLTNIVDLLVHVFQFRLARGKLRLQLRGGLLSFGSVHYCLPDAQYANLFGGSGCRGCLCVRSDGPNQGRGRERGHTKHLVHCSLLNFGWTHGP